MIYQSSTIGRLLAVALLLCTAPFLLANMWHSHLPVESNVQAMSSADDQHCPFCHLNIEPPNNAAGSIWQGLPIVQLSPLPEQFSERSTTAT
ncbi:MAG: hypothetical protein N2663_04540, partial [Chlorobi bacterium]|nr:hypothetical protein [Chlorobiota bacterium]